MGLAYASTIILNQNRLVTHRIIVDSGVNNIIKMNDEEKLNMIKKRGKNDTKEQTERWTKQMT